MPTPERLPAVTVYCGSSLGTQPAYQHAAHSVGRALATHARPLVYGGGSKGLMGIVSGAVLAGGGRVTGIIPAAMVSAGGEREKAAGAPPTHIVIDEPGREQVETIVVDSMHVRKVEMARRAGAFVGLPGGFGTFEEVLEATTWTQLGIHNKPVVLLNVLGFFEPLRALVRAGVQGGFIQPYNENLIVFVDGPEAQEAQAEFDWGETALRAIDEWQRNDGGLFDWSNGEGAKFTLASS